MSGKSGDKARAAPGAYILGDPCHVIPADEWSEYLACRRLGTDCCGMPVIAFSTMLGEGGCRDQDGHDHSVDSGVIGLVPESQAVHRRDGVRGRVVTFDRETGCAGCDERGTLMFGKIRIKTD